MEWLAVNNHAFSQQFTIFVVSQQVSIYDNHTRYIKRYKIRQFSVHIICNSYGGFLKWGYVTMDGLFQGKSHPEMDDDGDCPHFRKPPYPTMSNHIPIISQIYRIISPYLPRILVELLNAALGVHAFVLTWTRAGKRSCLELPTVYSLDFNHVWELPTLDPTGMLRIKKYEFTDLK